MYGGVGGWQSFSNRRTSQIVSVTAVCRHPGRRALAGQGGQLWRRVPTARQPRRLALWASAVKWVAPTWKHRRPAASLSGKLSRLVGTRVAMSVFARILTTYWSYLAYSFCPRSILFPMVHRTGTQFQHSSLCHIFCSSSDWLTELLWSCYISWIYHNMKAKLWTDTSASGSAVQ